MKHQLTWDIFCRVVDNYGDIGVCWRLARQLSSEHGQRVRLWVDDLRALMHIWPAATEQNQQVLQGVDVRCWSPQFSIDVVTADVVIEAFACDIPESYIEAMAAKKKSGNAPVWINLEYMSAEKWVEGCHLMASVHPATGLRKRFFFPGFTPATGGLLRERDLFNAQVGFDKRAFLQTLDISHEPQSLLVSLFAYENNAIKTLLENWSGSKRPVHCIVPSGKILASIEPLLAHPLEPGKPYRSGNLVLQSIPFLTQTQYDQLLWACDINFVRGEDSFVRAQWAGKLFVWHIYPQEDQVHITKLNAFLDLFVSSTDQAVAQRVSEFWRQWNEQTLSSDAWELLLSTLPAWHVACASWRENLVAQDDLATQLIRVATSHEREKTATEKPSSLV